MNIADNLSETQGPTSKYLGFFINDKDLLTGWASHKLGVKAAAQVANVYEDYFLAPAHFG